MNEQFNDIDGTGGTYRKCENIDMPDAVADVVAKTRKTVLANLVEEGYTIVIDGFDKVRAIYDSNGEKVSESYSQSFNRRFSKKKKK